MLSNTIAGTIPGLTLKAWVYFAGATGAILKSNGIASLTRPAAGQYTVTFTAPMNSANYVGANAFSSDSIGAVFVSQTNAGCSIVTFDKATAATTQAVGNFVGFYE